MLCFKNGVPKYKKKKVSLGVLWIDEKVIGRNHHHLDVIAFLALALSVSPSNVRSLAFVREGSGKVITIMCNSSVVYHDHH